VPIWIGGRGEKRTLRSAARYADGWNAPYIGPEEWIAKARVLDQWCETEGRDPRSILRSVNLGFYCGADAGGVERGERCFVEHWGGKEQRTGWLRGTPKQNLEMLGRFRDAGCSRVNIAFREGPYDWDALHAFATEVLPVFGARRPE
jgi:alkanesulfonate monooxygenase SsuD/methylene tetrahydromethanopterin reductase-like flavin-dependent oxidoreductase (luciferase family)